MNTHVNKTANKRTKGFTLIEILVALLILSLLVATFSYISSANFTLFRKSDDRSRIVAYTNDVIEKLKIAWSDENNFMTRSNFVAPASPLPAYSLELPMTVQRLNPSGAVVTSGPYYTSPLLYRVTIKIKYTDPATHAVSTYYTTAVQLGHPSPPSL